MTSSSWNPEQYLKFADARERPFADLIGRIATTDPERVVDLGCGPGNATRTLAARWPSAAVTGIDSSADMIGKATRVADGERLRFVVGDIAAWQPDEPVDVIVANAVLHWLPNHVELFPRWLGALRPGGTFAFQVPRPADDRGAAVLRAVTSAPRWAGRFDGVTSPGGLASGHAGVRSAAEYTDVLSRLGCAVDAWETTYVHVLPGDDPVLEWFAGSGLRPFFDRLTGEELDAFRADMAAGFRDAYPRQSYGTLLPFHRVFVVAAA